MIAEALSRRFSLLRVHKSVMANVIGAIGVIFRQPKMPVKSWILRESSKRSPLLLLFVEWLHWQSNIFTQFSDIRCCYT